ncbi:MAG: choice-of-anchor J domain-containing protein [Bacteroidales bacterium]|nr:choice-of-anchor J domain-containing protein [Bacteroidales bacterium]
MKRTSLRTRICRIGTMVCVLLGLLPLKGLSQIPDSDNVLMGYIDESFYGTYMNDKYNFLVWDGDKEPVVIPSLLSNTARYGRVMAGAWVNNEYYCITMGLEEEQNLYIAYEPLSQSLRVIGPTPVDMGSYNCDMAYNELTGELYALQVSTTGTWLYRLSLTEAKAEEIKGPSGASGITLDGIVPTDGTFTGLAFNSRGECYTVYGPNYRNAEICQVNLNTCVASSVAVTGIRSGTSNSITFAADPDKLFWYTLYRGDYVWEVDIQTGATQEATDDIGPFTNICHPKYPQGAPALPIADLRAVKNLSDYKEATFYCTLPSVDLQGKDLSGKLKVEIWKGNELSQMELIDSILNQNPGAPIAYTHTEAEEGTFVFSFRVFANGFYSPFAETRCPFYNVNYPYATSFEIDDERGVVTALGQGWQHWTNYRQYDWQPWDTLVRTGKYSYGVNLDTVSKLSVGNGLKVYKGVEYEFSFYVVGHARIVYGGRWIEGPEKPLEIVYDGNTELLTLPKQGSGVGAVKPYQYFARYSYRFTAKENGPLDITFRAVGDDSYFIDDFEINQLTLPQVPDIITDLAVNEDATLASQRKLSVMFTTPANTLGGEELTSEVDVVLQWSRYRNFSDALGQESLDSRTLTGLQPGSEQTVDLAFDKEGFYYLRAYAANEKGEAPLSEILEAGYMGEGFSFDLTVNDVRNNPIEGVSVILTPKYPEVKDAYTATTSATGAVAFEKLYTGTYLMELQHGLYETYRQELDLDKNTVLNIEMEDRMVYPVPMAATDLKITATDMQQLTVGLSWTNPALDVDQNTLTDLRGAIVSYSLEGGERITLDTLEGAVAGAAMNHTAVLPAQGNYSLSVSVYNQHGRSQEISVEAGYVGEGFNKTILCSSVDGETVKNVRITLLSGEERFVATGGEDGKVNLQGVRRGSYTLFAMADYYTRLVIENFRVDNEETQLLEDFELARTRPELTGLAQKDNNITFTWSLKEDRNFTDGFESYPDFEIENIGDYKLGGAKSKGYFGGCTWPNILEDQSWIVFNPYATFPPVDEYVYWNTHSGNKMLCAMYTVRNDDWLVYAVEGSGTLKFWARGPQIDNSDPERFVVLYSATDDNFGSFTRISEGDFVQTTKNWTEYSYDLPEDAKYFAIHCVSDDASVLQIDDLSYSLSHGQKVKPAKGFELYIGDARVAVLDADVSTYTFENLPDGKHTLGVKAVYENGTSEMTTRTVVLGEYVATPINVQVNQVGADWVLSYEMPRGETAQYYKIFLDWELWEHVEATSYVLPPVNPSVEHVAGVCAVNNEHFSDTVWVKFNTGTASEKTRETEIRVQPNPSMDGKVRITTPSGGTLEIFAMDGKKILTREIAAGAQEINLNRQSGLYLVTVIQPDGSRLVSRLMVVR